MINEGFLEQRRSHPLGLGVVVALHGAVLTALILAPPDQILRILPTATTIYNVPDPTPPKPIPLSKTDPHPQKKPSMDDHPTTFPPLSPMGGGINILDTKQFPEIDLKPVDPPVHQPVLVEASADPRYAADFQPDYPSTMARAEQAGMVIVRILIGTDGRVHQVEAVSTTDPAFFDATQRQALRHWRFRPATRDGVAVESWRTITVRFQMPS